MKRQDEQQAITWVNISLPEKAKEMVDTLADDFESVAKQMAQLVAEGCRLSVKYSLEYNGFQVTLFGEGVNYGKGLVGRSNSYTKAMASVLVKHYVILQGVWEKTTTGKMGDYVE